GGGRGGSGGGAQVSAATAQRGAQPAQDLGSPRRRGFPCTVGPAVSRAIDPVDARDEAMTARVEAVARALCRARNIDPDHEGEPYPPGPVWQMFRQQAREFITMRDAASATD